MTPEDITNPIEERVAQLETEIAELKKARKINRLITAGLVVIVILVGPIFAASLMSGSLGIGIDPPLDTLDVNGDIRVRGSDIKDAGGTNRFRLVDNGNTIVNDRSGNAALTVDSVGDLRIGAGTGNYVNGAEERIRLVRGAVFASGTVHSGSGFTTSKLGVGHYRITFNNAFSGTPTATCTAWSLAQDRYCTVGITNGYFEARLFDVSTDALIDEDLTFIVAGPR